MALRSTMDSGGLLLRFILRDGRGARPDELRPGLLKPGDDPPQTLLVLGWRRGTVVDAEVEVDHVPFPVAQPHVEPLQPSGGRAAVRRGAVDVRLACQRLSGRRRVADRHGIPNQQHAGQLRVVFHVSPVVCNAIDSLALVDRQFVAAEVRLQDALPCLLLGRQLGDECLVLLFRLRIDGGVLRGGASRLGGFFGDKAISTQSADSAEDGQDRLRDVLHGISRSASAGLVWNADRRIVYTTLVG